MALQHILDTARKLGIPVVITDEAGEAAQVVMPFDDFAAMVGASSPLSPGKQRVGRPAPPMEPRTIPIRQEEDEIAVALAELDFEGIREEPLVREVSKPSPSGVAAEGPKPKDEEFLEEKFYLEPLDDQESLK